MLVIRHFANLAVDHDLDIMSQLIKNKRLLQCFFTRADLVKSLVIRVGTQNRKFGNIFVNQSTRLIYFLKNCLKFKFPPNLRNSLKTEQINEAVPWALVCRPT